MRFVGKLFAALIFGAMAGMAAAPIGMAFDVPTDPGRTGAIAMVIAGGAALTLVMFAPTVRRAWGRGFLVSGALLLALPVSAMIFTGRVAHDLTVSAAPQDQALAALGSGLAAGVVTGLAAAFGLILGGIFLIAGVVLSLGGRREVVIVNPVTVRPDAGWQAHRAAPPPTVLQDPPVAVLPQVPPAPSLRAERRTS